MEEANIHADTDFQRDQEINNEGGDPENPRMSEVSKIQESQLYYKINCYPANIMRMLQKGGIFKSQK